MTFYVHPSKCDVCGRPRGKTRNADGAIVYHDHSKCSAKRKRKFNGSGERPVEKRRT